MVSLKRLLHECNQRVYYMGDKYLRAIDHLLAIDKEENIWLAFHAVGNLFGQQWLMENYGHRLQLLWQRKDYLASSELYSLGKSINRLIQKNATWLESTAKEIKKNKDTSHGLITEIILIGSLNNDSGVVTPCNKSNPVYDYSVNYDTGFSYKVSIKNFDISVHEKAFNDKCEIIYKTFKNFLEFYKISGTLVIECLAQNLTKEILLDVCCFIAYKIKDHGHYNLGGGCFIIYNKLFGYEASRLMFKSGTLLVVSKQHKNEQRNIESKISAANASLLKDQRDKNSIKKLIIRIGETTDSERVKAYLQTIADDYNNCGFDMCFVFQPTVVNNQDGTSVIATQLIPITRSFFPLDEGLIEKLDNIGIGKIELGIGVLTTEKISRNLEQGGFGGKELPSCYTYQKGDIFISMKQDENGYSGTLSQPAQGIKVHAVMGNLVIKPNVFPDNSRLLIV
jgi:hypothetical protein